MNLRDYIDSATQKVGSQVALADKVGQTPANLRGARGNVRGIPVDACIKLARILDVDPLEVIAASELATEKKPEKRLFWEGFMHGAKAACMLMGLALVTMIMTAPPANAQNSSVYNALRAYQLHQVGQSRNYANYAMHPSQDTGQTQEPTF
ncbi:MAG: helix-turn-helix domain-containing protein [Zoogloeaceae bacterium]|jgi:hypothetical protein|nr:helix-turn-helix domain-containing protein [Zoogloeaceae bacterium]